MDINSDVAHRYYKAAHFVFLQNEKNLNFLAASMDEVLVNIVQKYCIKGKNKPDWTMEQSAMKVHRLFAETVKRGCDNAAAGLVERSEELATGFKLLPRSQRLKNFLKYLIPIFCSLFVNSRSASIYHEYFVNQDCK